MALSAALAARCVGVCLLARLRLWRVLACLPAYLGCALLRALTARGDFGLVVFDITRITAFSLGGALHLDL